MNIEIPDDTKTLSLYLSGGVDSAILLYLLCDITKNHVIIRPLTAVEINNRANEIAVHNIIYEMRKLFPNAKINDPIIKTFIQTNMHDDKARHFATVMHSLRSEVHFDGTTSNPPIAVMKKLNMFNQRDPDRDHVKHTQFKPFINFDKSDIAKLYIKYNLMDNLLPLTASCVSPIDGTEPCKKCWWCKEKYWAFGRYDYEYIN